MSSTQLEKQSPKINEEQIFSKMLEAIATSGRTEFGIFDILETQDIVNRKIWLTSAISDFGDSDGTSIDSIAQYILGYNANDEAAGIPVEERRPIMLYINSIGGDTMSGLHLIDIIRCSKTPVYTIVQGQAASMAFHVAIAGHKRFAMENSVFLVHDGQIMIGDSTSKTDDYMQFNKRFQKRLDEMVVATTKICHETLKKKKREEWYFFADEALELGVIDKIITPETGINDIL